MCKLSQNLVFAVCKLCHRLFDGIDLRFGVIGRAHQAHYVAGDASFFGQHRIFWPLLQRQVPRKSGDGSNLFTQSRYSKRHGSYSLLRFTIKHGNFRANEAKSQRFTHFTRFWCSWSAGGPCSSILFRICRNSRCLKCICFNAGTCKCKSGICTYHRCPLLSHGSKPSS